MKFEGDTLFIIYLVVLIVSFIIIYQIIRAAVLSATKEANKDVVDQLRLLNQFKADELLKSGHSLPDIKNSIQSIFPVKKKVK